MEYTTLKQSKRLIELGVDPQTADMTYYRTSSTLNGIYNWNALLGLDSSIKDNLLSFRHGYIFPCWSTNALMELLKDCRRLEISLTAHKTWNIFAAKDNTLFPIQDFKSLSEGLFAVIEYFSTQQ